MTTQDRIYHSLPVLGQHAVVSLRGAYLRRVRYTAHTWETLARLQQSQFWSKEKHAEYQVEQLERLVARAWKHSPFYNRLYAGIKNRPEPLRSLDQIRLLPIVSKQMVRESLDEIVCTDLDTRRLQVAFTSGTTGTPLRSYHTEESVQERFAFLERLFQWYSPVKWRKRASFTGKLVVDVHRDHPPFHRVNLPLHQQLYSSHHLKPSHLDTYVQELESFAPDQIDGIASPIFVVADHMMRSGRSMRSNPAVVIPTSETLMPHLRERISSAFRCHVANQYGSQEGAPLAYECPEGGFHVCPESGVFEILRHDGAPCAPGEVGRLVVTSFLSVATPLIRYEIGDLSAWREGECSCGRAMPMLQGIYGRIDDMFFTSERGLVTRVDSAFKGLPLSIVVAQVAQVGPDRFEVRIVPDKARYLPEHGQRLAGNLTSYLGERVQLEVRLVESVPRTIGGKMKAMVNEWNDMPPHYKTVEAWNAESLERTGNDHGID